MQMFESFLYKNKNTCTHRKKLMFTFFNILKPFESEIEFESLIPI